MTEHPHRQIDAADSTDEHSASQSNLDDLRRTLRGVVFSIRPTIARSLGCRSELDDLLTPDGTLAWRVGLRVVGASAKTLADPRVSRLEDWLAFELQAEQTRYSTFHVLAEGIESKLPAADGETRWTATAANVASFLERARKGETVMTVAVARRVRAARVAIEATAGANPHASVMRLLRDLGIASSLPMHPEPDRLPAPILEPSFRADLISWFQDS